MDTPVSQASTFLKRLDHTTERFCFRTFSETPDASGPSLAANFQGTFQECYTGLQDRNTRGAGVFVVINEGGQKKDDITRVRAVFADTDGADIAPIIAALPPHIAVNSSPGKGHVYWLVTEDFPLDQFKPVQLAIAEQFGTDKSVTDLPRVMRLPGFNHNKADPYLVRLLHVSDTLPRYSYDELVSGLKLNIGPTNNQPLATQSQRLNFGDLGYVKPDFVSDGNRNTEVLRYVAHLRGSGIFEDEVRAKVQAFNATKCQPPLNDNEVEQILSRYPEQANTRPSQMPPGDWPEPEAIKPALPAVPAFDLDMLPNTFRPFVEDAADLMDAPPDFLAVPLMVAAAATLGNRWCIAPKAQDHGWLVTPVLWGAIVGPPGAKKSPCLTKALAPLQAIEEHLAANFHTVLQRYEVDKIAYQQAKKLAEDAARNNLPIPPVPLAPQMPQPERLVVNDFSYQKLGDIHHWSPRGVAVVSDEIVGVMNAMETKGQEAARPFFLAAWNGDQTYRIDRIGRDSNLIDRLAIYLIGGMQPDKLQRYVRQATQGGDGNDGLMQRFQLLVWPDAPSEWRYVDRPHDQQAVDDVSAAIFRLRDLKPSDVNARNSLDGKYAFLRFSAQAQPLFVAVMSSYERAARNSGYSTSLQAHFAKYPRLVAALALVIHLVDGGVGPVSIDATTKAANWSKYLALHAERAYASGNNRSAVSAKALAEKIKAGKLASGFTQRTVERKGWQDLSDRADIEAALAWLIDANWLREEVPASGTGSRSKVYIINPRVNSA